MKQIKLHYFTTSYDPHSQQLLPQTGLSNGDCEGGTEFLHMI